MSDRADMILGLIRDDQLTNATSEIEAMETDLFQHAAESARLRCELANRDAYAVNRHHEDGTRWRHVKRGTDYTVIAGEVHLQTSLPRGDGADLIVYRGDDGKVWARAVEEFADGRFERIGPCEEPRLPEGYVAVPASITPEMADVIGMEPGPYSKVIATASALATFGIPLARRFNDASTEDR